MQKQPLIKQGWVRVLVFVIVLVITTALFTLAAGAILTAMHGGSDETDVPAGINQQFILLSLLFSFIASVLLVFLFRKVIDKQSLASLGLAFSVNRRHAATGFFLALFLLGSGSLFLLANKNLYWKGISFDATQLFLGFVLMALVAFTEELVFRGYILNNLMQSMNRWLALTLSAVLFALFHFSNPDIGLVALANIFLSGLLLGINYIFTKNLWFAILFHFGWNFYQGSVLGYKVSGLNVQGLLQQELSGNPLLTGGDFGLEGSLVAGLLSLIGLLTLALIYTKKFPVSNQAR